ncbi:MAG: peptide-methionine (S)-S-oxide reductase MsrA [Longimicrobiales bacterium]|nr:peptide-methionine (S)-S-oxide reductase MsrA [Longimicrobiales bacterium]
MNDALEWTTLGGGCFWCLEAVFQQVEGVERVESGYAGGTTPDPTYREVCSGTTGHAEVVRVGFRPRVIPFSEVLGIFFAVHDPTTRDRQGADVGTQYRSIVLAESAEQEATARRIMEELDASAVWDAPLVTEVVRLERFHPAEPYHRDYYRNNPAQAYCRTVVGPKVAKFRARFAHRLRAP